MSAKHTPLPWKIEEQGDGIALYSAGGSHCVCFFNTASKSTAAARNKVHAKEEMRANAELIMAALALLPGEMIPTSQPEHRYNKGVYVALRAMKERVAALAPMTCYNLADGPWIPSRRLVTMWCRSFAPRAYTTFKRANNLFVARIK